MFKILNIFILFFIYYNFVISQPLSFGFSYGKNFTHATTLMRAVFSKANEIESHAFPKDEYSLLLQYNIYKNNWLGLEPRLIERQTSYCDYEPSAIYTEDNYLRSWELLINYSQFIFSIKNKLSFNFHLLTGYSHLINYQLKSTYGHLHYDDIEPRKIDGIIIGYGLNLSYLMFNQKLKFFLSGSLSHLSIMNLYNIDCNIGIAYILKKKEETK